MADDIKNEGAENLFEVFNKHFDEYLERYGVATPKQPVKPEPKHTGVRFPVSQGTPAAQKIQDQPEQEEEVYFDPADYVEEEPEVDVYEEVLSDPTVEGEISSDEYFEPEVEEQFEEVTDDPEYVEDEEPEEVYETFEEPEQVEVDEPVDDEYFEPEVEDEVPSYEEGVEYEEDDVYFDPDSVVEEPDEEPEQPQRTVEREILREVLVVDRDQAKDLGYGADRYLQEQPVDTTPTPRQAPSFTAPPVTEPKISEAPRVERPQPREQEPETFRERATYRPEPEPEKRTGFFSTLFSGRKNEPERTSTPTREYREVSRVRDEGLDSSSFDTTSEENAPIRLNTQDDYDPRAERLRLQHVVTERRDVDPAVWLEETMLDALKLDASDLHIVVDGETRDLRARIRVDGQMRDFDYVQGVPARVIMGRLKAATELSSGGSFAPEETIYTIELDGEQRKARAVLFRVEDGGEALVMRLPLTGSLRQLNELSFADYNLQHVYDLLAMPYKLIMIAGPMGSGKTTTAHGALMHVAKQTRTVWTIEDPVERRLPNLVQLEIDEDNGAGFDVLLSKLLRADYNTLFLGEIRDNATAAAAVRQAKAGRQVMSTIHADDNIKALMRLIELAGDSPLSVLSAVGGVISQRLVRRLNPEWDGVDPDTKYKGRVPIHEILFVDDNLVEVMMEGKALSQIKQATAEAKGSTFAEDARRLIAAGVTDREELLAVIGEYEEKK